MTDHDGSNLIGPYEDWTYYELGKNYSGLSGKEPYIAAVLQFKDPTAVDSAELVDKADAAGTKTVYWPTLWRPSIQGGQPPMKYSLLPAVLVSQDKQDGLLSALAASRPNDTALFTSIFQEIKTMTPPLKLASDPSGVRLNTPIPPESFNTTFAAFNAPGAGVETINFEICKAVEASKEAFSPIVLMAVIDDGLPFGHRNFREKGGGTRLECCWLQSAKSDNPNGRVLFGRELSRADINDWLAAKGGDEDSFYRNTAAADIDPKFGATINHFGSHGSHVLDAAAGFNPDLRTAESGGAASADLDRLRIIGVQLPSPVTIDTTGFGKEAFILSAFHYIFERADRIEAKYREKHPWFHLPLVINFSYGFSGGPHDGQDRLEAAINELINARRAMGKHTLLVMPSGNTYASSLHGVITPGMFKGEPGEETFTIPWRIQPNDRTSNYLEIWLPPGAAEPRGIAAEIFDPSGADTLARDRSRPGAAAANANVTFKRTLTSGGRPIGRFSIEHYRDYRWRIVIILAPTEPENPAHPAAPAGLWRVVIAKPAGLKEGDEIHCRIQRDNDPFGYTRGARQSYFDDPRDQRYDASGKLNHSDMPGAFVRRSGTLNGLSTHSDVIVVGGFMDSTGKAAIYSSAGPGTGQPNAAGEVNLSAPSDDSPVLQGRLGAGTRSGSVFRLNGTSVAAPQVARAIAIALLSAKKGDTLPVPADKNPLSALAKLIGGSIGITPVAAAGNGSDENRARLGKERLRLRRR